MQRERGERKASAGPGELRAGLHRRIVDHLRAMILDGSLRPGQRLPEIRLCKALGVSRTPLREAFKLPGTPIRITLREKANPFAHKRKRPS